MNKSKRPLKTMVFSLGLAAMLLPVSNLSAQDGGGLFGRGEAAADSRAQQGSILTHETFGINHEGTFSHDVFGANHESGFTHDTFGETPTGSGLLVLLAAGMGYAAAKKRKGGKGQRNKSK